MIRTLVAHAELPGKLKDVFFSLSEDPEFFPKHFRGFAPFVPAILKVRPDWKGKLKIGETRVVELSDGTSVRERITEHKPSTLHRYEMVEFNFMQKLVCKTMSAEFLLKESGKKVDVTWSYSIGSNNPLQYPLILIVGWAFGKAMNKCLASMSAG